MTFSKEPAFHFLAHVIFDGFTPFISGEHMGWWYTPKQWTQTDHERYAALDAKLQESRDWARDKIEQCRAGELIIIHEDGTTNHEYIKILEEHCGMSKPAGVIERFYGKPPHDSI
jgi:hypothetical protein